jgi:hypothetical protein
MKSLQPLLPLVLLMGWLGLHGLAPSPLLACDSGGDTPAKAKPKGK